VIEQFLNGTSTHYRLFSAVGGNIDDGSGLKGECLTLVFSLQRHVLLMVCFQTLERKKRTLLGQKMPFAKGRGRGWSEDAFSSEDGQYITQLANDNNNSNKWSK